MGCGCYLCNRAKVQKKLVFRNLWLVIFAKKSVRKVQMSDKQRPQTRFY